MLRAEGYVTLCTGKWHLAPTSDTSAAGPFDQWPLARGFDRFYGFLEGETDQFHPELVTDNQHIAQPKTAQQGYHLSEDLVDQMLKMINDNRSIRPDRPFFAYLPFGATHAPHQAPQAYLDKYRHRYDEGWDVARQQWYERQLELGVIPKTHHASATQSGREALGGTFRERATVCMPTSRSVRGILRPHRRPNREVRRWSQTDG